MGNAVFLSYASQDAAAAQQLYNALRAAGVEVWFDQSELRGGDTWDASIRRQIKSCALFIPVISKNTHARGEGYFRLEWKLAVDRSHLMASDLPFLLPVVVDDTPDREGRVPDRFREVQWTRLPGGANADAFVEHVRRLLAQDTPKPSVTGVWSSALPTSSSGAASTRSTPPASRPYVPWVVGGLLILATGYIAADKFLASKHAMPAAEAPTTAPARIAAVNDKSIAVLPFADMSEKKDQEYFADGLSEEILNLLAGIPTLSVIGRTSSFQFKGKNDDLRAIGTKLGAAYVLEGSVRRSVDRVRVNAQLINTLDGVHRWSNTYDRPFGDVLKLQDELAASVARAMEVTVGSDTLQSHTAPGTPEAYDFYLRGLHAMDRYDRAGFDTAANYFQQALQLDPTFAAAATELGRIVVFQAEFGFASPIDTYERARRSLETAIRLDPDSGMAHAWLGWVHMAYDWDWPAADLEMKRALRLSPRDPVVLLCAARLAHAVGYWDDAIRQLSAAIARDPLYPAASNDLSEVYARTGRLAEAETAARRVLEISPTYSSGPYNLALVLLALGRREEALRVITEMQQATMERTHALVLIYYALGRNADSDAQLAALTRDHAGDDAFEIAEAHAYRGQVDEAFRWLDRAYKQKDAGLYLVKGDLLLKNLEGDPRHKAFMTKMKLPE